MRKLSSRSKVRKLTGKKHISRSCICSGKCACGKQSIDPKIS